jgi:hypothetical protein
MRPHLHWLVRRRIHRLFTLAPAGHCRALLREVAGCRACARLYDQYQTFEAALCGTGGSGAPSGFAVERIEQAVRDGVSGAKRGPARRRKVWLPAGISTAALIAAAVVLLVWPRFSGRDDHVAVPVAARLVDVGLVARGGTPQTSEVGIRVFRVAGQADQPARPRVAEVDALALDDVITFTYTIARADIRYAVLFGVQADGAIRWYYPGYGGQASVPLHGDKVDEPLGDGIKLRVHHKPGWLRITAIFSAQPIAVEVVSRSLEMSMASRPESLQEVAPLPIPGAETLQHAILTHIVQLPR